VHAETVRIHGFVDGNGRTTRLLADLVFLAAQDAEAIGTYDWDIDKRRYIALLRTTSPEIETARRVRARPTAR
jgi:Fic family protein